MKCKFQELLLSCRSRNEHCITHDHIRLCEELQEEIK